MDRDREERMNKAFESIEKNINSSIKRIDISTNKMIVSMNKTKFTIKALLVTVVLAYLILIGCIITIK